MSSPAPTSAPADAHVADAIARAEVRRAQLERLAVIGMELAEEIRERNVHAPLHPEPRHEPGRAFASISRAVRLTLAFAARIDADISAMRNNKEPSRSTAVKLETASSPSSPKDLPDPRRAKVKDAVWTAINHEIEDLERATCALDRVHESLIEGEDYDALLARPWRECVEAICADLGLQPDWSLWSDETGFSRGETEPRRDWPRLWRYDRGDADARRRRGGERLKAAEGPARAAAHPPDPNPRQ